MRGSGMSAHTPGSLPLHGAVPLEARKSGPGWPRAGFVLCSASGQAVPCQQQPHRMGGRGQIQPRGTLDFLLSLTLTLNLTLDQALNLSLTLALTLTLTLALVLALTLDLTLTLTLPLALNLDLALSLILVIALAQAPGLTLTLTQP